MQCRSIIGDWLKGTFAFVCRLLLLQDKIVFSNFYGRGLGDDPKYILMELKRRKVNVKFIWLVNDLNTKMPEMVRPVRYASFLSIYHLSTAKVWIDNARGSYRVKKRSRQFFIQTWHSTLSMKKHEAEAMGLTGKYVASAKRDATITDLMYTNNTLRLEEYKYSFWYEGHVVKCDVPRVAILLHTPQGLRKKVLTELNVAKDVGIVLYAPTFRQNGDTGVYDWCYKEILRILEEKYGKSFIFLFRLHPHLSTSSTSETNNKSIINVFNYPDMQELLAVADILITDFSGCMFDFGITHRPIFLFAKDYEVYLRTERNLHFKEKDLPFPIAKNIEQLTANILRFDATSYIHKVNTFYEKVGWCDTGKGDKHIADLVLEHLNTHVI